MEETLGLLLAKVVGLRLHYAIGQETLRNLRADWDAENADFLVTLKQTQERLALAEDALRGEALAIYESTDNKQVAPGVVIRVNTELHYDEDLALAWAKAHDIALVLDRKMFEEIAKVKPPTFIEVRYIPQATLAKNLEAPKENTP